MTSADCQHLIICQRSEYFHRLCGPGSHFAESKQSEIELKDVDSQAMQLLLQHLYSIEPDPFQAPWRTWLNLRTTADKYLLSDLRKLADTSLRSAVGCITNADSIFTIIRTLEDEHAHDDALTALAKSLRRENLHKLLRNARYRAYLDEDKSRLWSSWRSYLSRLVCKRRPCQAVNAAENCGGGIDLKLLIRHVPQTKSETSSTTL